MSSEARMKQLKGKQLIEERNQREEKEEMKRKRRLEEKRYR